MNFRNFSRHFLPFIAVLSLPALSCEEPFSSGRYEPRLIVFSILSTDRDAQFVRVHSNAMPSEAASSDDHAVSDATVQLADPDTAWLMTDTTLTRRDTSRFTTPLRAYVLTPFVPEYGKRYEIHIDSPSLGSARGAAVIPGKASVSIDASTEGILRIPLRFPAHTTIPFTVRFSGLSKAYTIRFWVYFDVQIDGQWFEERMEVPVGSDVPGSYSLEHARYSGLTLTPSANIDLEMKYELGFYQEVIREITTRKYKNNRLIYKWLSLVILQTDENLYRYYSAVHEYQDPRSVRLDQPLYSSIQGGHGVVGAYALDSLLYILPSNFDGNR